MKISPLAGKPAPAWNTGRMCPGSSRPTIPSSRPRGAGAASGVWHFRASRFRLSSGLSTNGTSSRSPRRFACIANGRRINGPLFLGIDTHALSIPACATALEVLAANGVEVMIAEGDEYTPTPVISHAILTYNRGRKTGLADGIVITPSHNPPHDGGFKYNPAEWRPGGQRRHRLD